MTQQSCTDKVQALVRLDCSDGIFVTFVQQQGKDTKVLAVYESHGEGFKEVREFAESRKYQVEAYYFGEADWYAAEQAKKIAKVKILPTTNYAIQI